MADVLTAALSAKFPEGLPDWVDPFFKAVRRLEIVEKREGEGKTVTISAKPSTAKPKKKPSKKKPSKKSKALRKEEDEEDDGLGDEVTDQEMMQRAEEYLKTAIELSEGAEALPHTWMAVLLMKAEDWVHARENALQAAELEPLCSTILFRLSACYAQEKDYVNAHAYHERGISLLPLAERLAYIAKLDRLKEQADDVKAKVFRADPFDILPLEVVINIMEHGLEDNRDLVLKASWVNRRWRSVLINSCPELWRTLRFTHTGFTKAFWEEKTLAWASRAGKINTIAFEDFSLTAADRITRKQGKYLADAETLIIQFRHPQVLMRLASMLSRYERGIVHLDIRRGYGTGGRSHSRGPPVTEISCGMLPDIASCQRVQTIELIGVSFERYRAGMDLWGRGWNSISHGPPIKRDYSGLKRLVVKNCGFENSYGRPSYANVNPEGTPKKYQSDPLHLCLRGAPNLEFLELEYRDPYDGGKAYKAGQGKRITMPALKSAIVPPPSVWCIDILAPNLESLAYHVPFGVNSYEFDHRSAEKQLPLIPAIDDAPVGLAALKSVKLECYKRDDGSIFEDWVSRLVNVTKLVVSGARGSVYPEDANKDLDNRASTRALQLLTDNLGKWCPLLVDLEFDSCFTPGKSLVEYVRKRKQTAGCAALERLALARCPKLSEKAKTALEQEVPNFTVERECYISEHTMALYLDDNFDGPVKNE